MKAVHSREIHYGHLINVLYVHVKIRLLCVKMSAVLVLTVIQKRGSIYKFQLKDVVLSVYVECRHANINPKLYLITLYGAPIDVHIVIVMMVKSNVQHNHVQYYDVVLVRFFKHWLTSAALYVFQQEDHVNMIIMFSKMLQNGHQFPVQCVYVEMDKQSVTQYNVHLLFVLRVTVWREGLVHAAHHVLVRSVLMVSEITRMVNIGTGIVVLHVYVYKEKPSVGVKTA